MKFAEHLAAHITPEWRKQYINYEELKKILYEAVEKAPDQGVDPEIIDRYLKGFDSKFLRLCDKEMKKIDTFYSEKLAEATRKYATLSSELKDAKAEARKSGLLKQKDAKITSRKEHEFKLGFSEYYLSLILLQNFQQINLTGFRKLLKKHDKIFNVDTGMKWLEENVETANFAVNKIIDTLIQDTEQTVTNELEDGNRQKAMQKLRVPPIEEQKQPWVTFKVGLHLGVVICLLLAIVLSVIFRIRKQTADPIRTKTTYTIFRGPFLVFVATFLIGINVHYWGAYGVNRVLIFELDPRHNSSAQDIMETGAFFLVALGITLLLHLYSDMLRVPHFVFPLVFYIFWFLFLVNPINICKKGPRYWLLDKMRRILCAPFCFVRLPDFWLADVMNSLVVAMGDIYFTICFYCANRSIDVIHNADNCYYCFAKNTVAPLIVSCLPAWFRLMQCFRRYRDTKEAFPHLVNAFKYTWTVIATLAKFTMAKLESKYDHLSNPGVYLFFICSTISALYAHVWDISVDWGLMSKNAGRNLFLREEIVYPKSFYYVAMIENLILRFAWIVAYLQRVIDMRNDELVTTFLALCEVFRRFIWNFIRLENEHLNNCGKFRAVRDISVAPIDTSDQVQILKMMDTFDGVVNRKQKKKSKIFKKISDTTLDSINEMIPE